MERAAAVATSSRFVRWEERYLTSARGRKEVHFYLKREDGTSNLAVVGKEKSFGHMSYRYAIRDQSLLSISPATSFHKLRSRKDVIDWLNTVVSDFHSHRPSQTVSGPMDDKSAFKSSVKSSKDIQLQKLGQHSTNFLWIGSPWTCKKRRKHYQSFCRNSVKISVHDFVYILAEEDKRLVAYLNDMYEDSRGNNIVMVQWFHKIDEVGTILPHNYNGREIFFSHCLQDLSVECIDGSASVLSPHHYEKFLSESSHIQAEPFVCRSQFDSDEVYSFDITRVKGYWNQEILRYLLKDSPSKYQFYSNDLKVVGHLFDDVITRPKKRLCQSKDGEMLVQSVNNQSNMDAFIAQDSRMGPKHEIEICSIPKSSSSASILPGRKALLQKQSQNLTVGHEVEVLSQDSGIRGCWFRAIIIKKHKDKIKVRYQDIKDAADDVNYLEEWILASKVAHADESGLRDYGRAIVRPSPPSNKDKVSWFINIGSIVDVWWHDGWWEGIVIQKDSEDRFRVYFPGENRDAFFDCSVVRLSQEWLENEWKHVKERPDCASSVLSTIQLKLTNKTKHDALSTHEDHSILIPKGSISGDDGCYNINADSEETKVNVSEVALDLSKDDLFARLKWKSSRKRRHSKNNPQKVNCSVSQHQSAQETLGLTCEKFFFPSSLKIDPDNCKYARESLFTSSVVPPLTSLVMSR